MLKSLMIVEAMVGRGSVAVTEGGCSSMSFSVMNSGLSSGAQLPG